MVTVEPSRLLSHPQLAPHLAAILPPERLDAYAASTGVDPRRVPSACVAGFDLGTLYLAQVASPIQKARDAFVERLSTDPIVSVPGENLVQVMGLVGTNPQVFLGLEPDRVAYAVNDPSLTRVVVGFATGKLRRSPRALAGAALSKLPPPSGDVALRFLAPGPFLGAWQRGVHGLLANTLAVDIRATPLDSGQLDVELLLLGDYSDDEVADTEVRVRSSLTELQSSTLGSLVGLNLLPQQPTIRVGGGLIAIRAQVPIAPLMQGLSAAVAMEVREIMGFRGGKAPAGG